MTPKEPGTPTARPSAPRVVPGRFKGKPVERSRAHGERSVGPKAAKLFRRFARAVGLSETGVKRLEVTYTAADADARGALRRKLEHLLKRHAEAEAARKRSAGSPLHVDRETIGRFLSTGELPEPRIALIGPPR